MNDNTTNMENKQRKTSYSTDYIEQSILKKGEGTEKGKFRSNNERMYFSSYSL